MRVNKRQHTVYVIEDHPIFFDGIRGMLEGDPDFKLLGHAATASQAKDEIPELRPELILLDLGLPDGSGFGLIQYLKAVCPGMRILVVSGLDQSLYACRAVRSGAHGFLSKRKASSLMLKAMRAVVSGEVYLDSDLASKLLSSRLGRIDMPADPLEDLSNRELDVYRLIGTGLSVQEIADRLHLSPKTVETYRANIKRKLGVDSARDLVRDATIWWLEGRREVALDRNAA